MKDGRSFWKWLYYRIFCRTVIHCWNCKDYWNYNDFCLGSFTGLYLCESVQKQDLAGRVVASIAPALVATIIEATTEFRESHYPIRCKRNRVHLRFYSRRYQL